MTPTFPSSGFHENGAFMLENWEQPLMSQMSQLHWNITMHVVNVTNS